MRKLIITIISIIAMTSTVFAEAAIIYAPTKAPELKATVDNEGPVVSPEVTGPTGSIVDSSLKSDPVMADYTGVHNLYEDSNSNYYVKSGNNYVKNAWRKISLNSFDKIGAETNKFNHNYIWCYCGSNGRLIKASSGKMRKVAIDGSVYAFNEYGQLLEGYFNDSGEMPDNDEDPWQILSSDNYLYYADIESGKLFSGWQKYNGNAEDYDWKDNIWFYFDPKNYRSIKSKNDYYKLQTIGDKKFAFDSNGVMLTGMDALKYKSETDESIKYFNSDGSVITNGFAVLSFEDDTVSENYSDYEDYDEDIAIYLNKSGKIYKDMIKKINNAYYGFDKKGVVLKNCIGIYKDSHYVDNIAFEDTEGKNYIINGKYTNKNGENKTLDLKNYDLHYFDKSGKRQLSGSIEFSDEKYTWGATNSGANEGLKTKKYYTHGILMKPIDYKYGLYILNPVKTNYTIAELYTLDNVYVVDKNGSKVSDGAKNDSDDKYWLISSSGTFLGCYNCKVKKSSGKYQWYSENDRKWIDFDTNDTRGKNQNSYKVRPDSDCALNFKLS